MSVEITKKRWKLNKEQELRLEVNSSNTFKLKLESGTCEIFGTELVKNVWYELSEVKVGIFTWHGCEIIGEGICSEYVADETPMISYINTHLALENLRNKRQLEGKEGPRVLIIGPKDSGKTSLSKILLNYAIRQGREPLFIDLDVTGGSISMPGVLSVTSLDYILDAESGFRNLLCENEKDDSIPPSLVYYYGFSKPSENYKLYQMLVSRLGDAVKKRLTNVQSNKTAGCIIDTSGLAEENGIDIHMHAITSLNVDVVLVVGHERLYSDLTRATKDIKDITVLRLAKSGGVVNRDMNLIKELQSRKMKEYFYGTPKWDLTPSPNVINFDDIQIFKVGESNLAPTSALPVGMDRKLSETRVSKVELGEQLLHCILGVCNTDSTEGKDVINTNVHGFVYVTDVDVEKRTITLLMPSPGKLPKKNLILGSFQWIGA